MPLPKPPSNEVFAHAAELRAAGATWESVAKEVRRAARTVRRWPRKYPDRWAAALVQAERLLAAQSDCESVLTLRRLLVSPDELVRWRAAKCLIARRVERDKLALKTPPAHTPLTSEAARLIAFLDGHPDEELAAIVADLAPLPAPATD
jgi:HEAT repeat protein